MIKTSCNWLLTRFTYNRLATSGLDVIMSEGPVPLGLVAVLIGRYKIGNWSQLWSTPNLAKSQTGPDLGTLATPYTTQAGITLHTT